MDEKTKIATQAIMQLSENMLQVQSQWGRWLVATLVAIHGAIIGYGASQEILMQALKGSLLYIPYAGFIFAIAGLLLALLSGCFAWINWAKREAVVRGIIYQFLHYDMEAPDLSPIWKSKDGRLSGNASQILLGASILLIMFVSIAIITNLP